MRKIKPASIAMIALTASVGLGAYLSRPAAPPVSPTPRADRAPLTKRFPFLGDFEKCSWVGGIKDDRSKGRVPAPSSYYVRAFVVLDPAQAKELLGRYRWVESKGQAIPGPAEPLGDGFPAVGGPCWKSEDLIRSLPTMTEFASGTILLQPEGNLLYLDLQAN